MATQRTLSRRHSQFTIADDLGLSQATVSNALNGKRQLCSPENYARIWAHALAVGYRGKGIAQEALPAQVEIRQVGLVRGRMELQVDQMLLAAQWAMEEVLAENAIGVVSLGAWDRPPEKLMRKLWRSGMSKPAIVVLGEVPLACLMALKARTHRLLTVGCHYSQEATAVLNNDEQSADLLLAHLASQGHKRVVWLGGGEASQSLAARMAAVATAASNHQMDFRADFGLSVSKVAALAGREGARRMLHRYVSATGEGRPTAVVCSHACVARAAIDEFAGARFAVPGEMSVVAIDSPTACDHDLPVTTSASSDPVKMGIAIARHIMDFSFSAGGHFRRVVLPASLTVGKTSGPVGLTVHGPSTRKREIKRVIRSAAGHAINGLRCAGG